MSPADEAKDSESDARASSRSLKLRVMELLKAQRYEEALTLLYKARAQAPESAELRRSVAQVKELLTGKYAQLLGGLDQVAPPLAGKPRRSPDDILLAKYIDGESTFADIAEVCPLGRLRTLQLLTELYAVSKESSEEPQSEARAISGGPHDEEEAPITARSHSSNAPPPLPPSSRIPGATSTVSGSRDSQSAPKKFKVSVPGDAHPFSGDEQDEFKETFEAGTAAFIQQRFSDAVALFEKCLEVRANDQSAEVMLRNSRRSLAASGQA